MYKAFADLSGTYEAVKTAIDALHLHNAYVRKDTWHRKEGQTSYNVTRVYLTSTEDYAQLTSQFNDTFPVKCFG